MAAPAFPGVDGYDHGKVPGRDAVVDTEAERLHGGAGGVDLGLNGSQLGPDARLAFAQRGDA